jgi:hypothetical protein
MTEIEIARAAGNIFEREINNHRIFYRKYLLKHKNERLELLSELNPLLAQFQNYQGKGRVLGDKKFFEIIVKIKSFIEENFGEELLQRFNKEVSYKKSKLRQSNDEGFLDRLFTVFAIASEEQNEKTKAEINYRINFLSFFRDCLNNQGLHKYILERDPRIFKRFNLQVTFKENKKEYYIARALLSQNELESDYLVPFYKGKQLFIHGKIIKASTISKLNVTTTLLWHDDEIELFGHVKRFVWNKTKKDENSFAKHCFDETNIYLKNPDAEIPKKTFKNNSITYIEQSRIDELASIKTKKFDTSKLVSLCNELNQCSTIGSVIAVAGLQRTIINHIPPIFGLKDFGQIVAQYKTGKSVKKNFDRLLNSMKNISDNHLHSQITQADSLPNMTQVDFSNDLDVLLAEVCKILKSNK